MFYKHRAQKGEQTASKPWSCVAGNCWLPQLEGQLRLRRVLTTRAGETDVHGLCKFMVEFPSGFPLQQDLHHHCYHHPHHHKEYSDHGDIHDTCAKQASSGKSRSISWTSIRSAEKTKKTFILLMDKILHHLGWLKPYKWDNHHDWWCRILSINSKGSIENAKISPEIHH